MVATETAITPKEPTAVALTNVTLICSSTSSSVNPTAYSWHRVDGDIPAHSSGLNSNTFTIHRVVPADEGRYYCMGEWERHCGKSESVTLTVKC